jgi:NTE family protein
MKKTEIKKKDKVIAVVLGGGSIKGAYQIGQFSGLIEQGIYPDIITGISVGALNGLLYVNNIGRGMSEEKAVNHCREFWIKNIRKPKDIIRKRNVFELAYQILGKKFKGLVDTSKLDKLVYENINLGNVSSADIQYYCGAVNLRTGEIEYISKDSLYVKEHAIASSRIPVIMPTSEIFNNIYYDGGIIDNAGIGKAIELGATDIYVLATHPKETYKNLNNKGNIFELINRTMELTVQNTLDNDIRMAQMYNMMPDDQLKEEGKRRVNINVFRPKEYIDVDITNFNQADISIMVSNGMYDVSEKLLKMEITKSFKKAGD